MGPSGSGKSSCIRFLRNLKALCTEPNLNGGNRVANVRVAPSILGSWPGRNTFVFTKEFQQTFRMLGKNRVSILDDLNEGYSKDVCDLSTKGSYHRNTSVILITQNLFHQSKYCRGIPLKAKYIV